MSAFANDTSVESLVFSAPIEVGKQVYLFEIVVLKGGVYAAGYSDLLGSVRYGWHADLGVLLDFATSFNPPNFWSERDQPNRMALTFARHSALRPDDVLPGGIYADPIWSGAQLFGHHNGHVSLVLLRKGWDDFMLVASSGLGGPSEVARSRHAEPLLRAMQPIVRTTDLEVTRRVLAEVPDVVRTWRAANLVTHRPSAVA